MLMDGLTGHEDDSNNTRFVSEDKLAQFLGWCRSGAGVVVGVSGIGKTRTILEILAEHWGDTLHVRDVEHLL